MPDKKGDTTSKKRERDERKAPEDRRITQSAATRSELSGKESSASVKPSGVETLDAVVFPESPAAPASKVDERPVEARKYEAYPIQSEPSGEESLDDIVSKWATKIEVLSVCTKKIKVFPEESLQWFEDHFSPPYYSKSFVCQRGIHETEACPLSLILPEDVCFFFLEHGGCGYGFKCRRPHICFVACDDGDKHLGGGVSCFTFILTNKKLNLSGMSRKKLENMVFERENRSHEYHDRNRQRQERKAQNSVRGSIGDVVTRMSVDEKKSHFGLLAAMLPEYRNK